MNFSTIKSLHFYRLRAVKRELARINENLLTERETSLLLESSKTYEMSERGSAGSAAEICARDARGSGIK